MKSLDRFRLFQNVAAPSLSTPYHTYTCSSLVSSRTCLWNIKWKSMEDVNNNRSSTTGLCNNAVESVGETGNVCECNHGSDKCSLSTDHGSNRNSQSGDTITSCDESCSRGRGPRSLYNINEDVSVEDANPITSYNTSGSLVSVDTNSALIASAVTSHGCVIRNRFIVSSSDPCVPIKHQKEGRRGSIKSSLENDSNKSIVSNIFDSKQSTVMKSKNSNIDNDVPSGNTDSLSHQTTNLATAMEAMGKTALTQTSSSDLRPSDDTRFVPLPDDADSLSLGNTIQARSSSSHPVSDLELLSTADEGQSAVTIVSSMKKETDCVKATCSDDSTCLDFQSAYRRFSLDSVALSASHRRHRGCDASHGDTTTTDDDAAVADSGSSSHRRSSVDFSYRELRKSLPTARDVIEGGLGRNITPAMTVSDWLRAERSPFPCQRTRTELRETRKTTLPPVSIPDPSSQKLKWTKAPLSVLIIRKIMDSTVLLPFRDMVIWLVEDKNMVVYVEHTVLMDPILVYDEAFQSVKDRLVIFKEGVDNLTDKVDFIICLGGDGTLLYASSLFQASVPPVMAINMGSLGFLTPFEFQPDFKRQVSRVMEGSASVLLHFRLKCVVVSSESSMLPHVKNINKEHNSIKVHRLVLNEVVVDRGSSPYLCNLDLYIEGRRVTSVQGDGLIISTPTGSTAYAVAAGASMIHPSVPCILITPICPHSLSFRPIVVPAGVEIRVMLCPDARGTAMVSFDGRDRQEMLERDSLRITTASYPVPSICAVDQIEDWFDGLAVCLNWNVRQPQRPLQSVTSLTSIDSFESDTMTSSQHSSSMNGSDHKISSSS